MKSESAEVVSISDVHLGHHNTTADEIIPNLYEAFRDTEYNNSLDLIIIAGDLFDRQLTLNNPQVYEIMLWAAQFLTWAARRNIDVRVLEGTKSHDWGQNRLLEVVAQMNQIPVNLHYIDTLSIEYIDSIKRHVLWVPDDWRPDPDVTWLEVTQLLQKHGLTEVDLSVVHGAFEHQLPEVAKAHPHRLKRYLEISKDFVLGGHIHTPGAVEHFRCNGSFDRICHGEEEEKGFWRLSLNRKTGNKSNFIVNKGAKKYITIDCGGLPLEDAMSVIRQNAASVPTGSFIRVRANEGDAVLTILDRLRKDYPQYTWSTKKDDRREVQSILLTDMRASFQAVQITPANVVELLLEQIRQKHTTDPAQLELCRQHLQRELNK